MQVKRKTKVKYFQNKRQYKVQTLAQGVATFKADFSILRTIGFLHVYKNCVLLKVIRVEIKLIIFFARNLNRNLAVGV